MKIIEIEYHIRENRLIIITIPNKDAFIRHRENGPARIWENGDQVWYHHDALLYCTLTNKEFDYEDH